MTAGRCKSSGLTNLNLEGRLAPKPLCRSHSTESSSELTRAQYTQTLFALSLRLPFTDSCKQRRCRNGEKA